MKHHCSRGSRAAGQALVASDVTLIIIRCILVPEFLEQGFDSGSIEHDIGLEWFLNLNVRIVKQIVNLLSIGLEPCLHVIGHAVDVKWTIANGKNLLSTVITSHNDKILVGVEDVVDRCIGM